MLHLSLAAVFFAGLHILVAGGSLRETLIARFGRACYHAGFGILSLAGLAWLAWAWRTAPYVETWGQLTALKPLVSILMLLVAVLISGGLGAPDPMKTEGEARGIFRVTRQPLLSGLGLWAALHILVNGDVATLMLFGALWATVVAGIRSIEAKRQTEFGERWTRLTAQTSIPPGLAILQHRQPRDLGLIAREIGWARLGAALGGWLTVLYVHAALGVPALF